ncbi:MAG: HepT-like ribonuclease domain-containing protein [Xanthobacteraceae bacterium]
MTYRDFCADIRTVYAVTRCFEIISEASRRLPKQIKARHAEIPWTDIAGAGSVHRHSYEDVLEQILWHTIETGLKPLQPSSKRNLAGLRTANMDDAVASLRPSLT